MRTLGTHIHGFIGWQVYLLFTSLLGLGIALGALVTGRDGWGPTAALKHIWGRWMWWCNPFWKLSIEGPVPDAEEGPFVLVSNHTSTLDIPALLALGFPTRVVARPGIFHVPVMGPFLAMSGQVRSDRLFSEGAAALERGDTVAVFAEGSRSTDRQLQRFRAGAFRLATDTGRPIVPVVVRDTDIIMARKAYWPTAPFVHVKVYPLPPVYPIPGESHRDLSARVRSVMQQQLEAL